MNTTLPLLGAIGPPFYDIFEHLVYEFGIDRHTGDHIEASL